MSETVGRIEQLTNELRTASPFRSVEITRQLLDVTEVLRSERLAKLAAMEERKRCLALAGYVQREAIDAFNREACAVAQRIISLIEDGRTVEELLAADGG